MTERALRRLVEEAINTELLEETLKAVIRERLDYEEMANIIWDKFESDFTEIAAEMAAPAILPF